jgi:hypothetical protein
VSEGQNTEGGLPGIFTIFTNFIFYTCLSLSLAVAGKATATASLESPPAMEKLQLKGRNLGRVLQL